MKKAYSLILVVIACLILQSCAEVLNNTFVLDGENTNGENPTRTNDLDRIANTKWEYEEDDLTQSIEFFFDGTYEFIENDLTFRGEFEAGDGVVALTSLTYAKDTGKSWSGNCKIRRILFPKDNTLYAFCLEKNQSAAGYLETWNNVNSLIYTDVDTSDVIGIATRTYTFNLDSSKGFSEKFQLKFVYNNTANTKDTTEESNGTYFYSWNNDKLYLDYGDENATYGRSGNYLYQTDPAHSFHCIKTLLDAPVITDTTVNGNEITLNWSKVSGVSKYIIYYTSSLTDNTVKEPVSATQSSHTLTSLSTNVNYTVWITASNDYCESNPSQSYNLRTYGTQENRIPAPVNLDIRREGTSLRSALSLCWDPIDEATGYKVYHALSPDKELMSLYKNTTDTEIEVKASQEITIRPAVERNQIEYFFRVSAFNDLSESDLSEEYCSVYYEE